MIRQYNKLDEDESSWIYELKNVNERLLYISQNFDKKFDDYPESFFRAQAAVCDCICQILDHVKYKEKPNGLLETMIEADVLHHQPQAQGSEEPEEQANLVRRNVGQRKVP